MTVSGSVTGGHGVSAPDDRTLTIEDDETTPVVSLVLTPSSIGENGGASTVTATLSGTSSAAVTVTVSATAVSPAVSGDFTQSGTTLTIAAGSTTSTGTVTLTAVNNTVDAPDKTVTVSGSVTGGHGVSAPSSQTLTIRDDEGTPTVSLVLAPSSVAENGGASRVTATLSGTSSAAVTVTVSATAVSPAVSSDFTLSGTTLTIAAGSTASTGTVTLTAVNNTVDAPDKTVTVSGSVTGGNGVSAPSSQTLTIRDDEGTPTVSLVLAPSSVAENGGASRVTATLSGTSSAAVTVTVSATAVSPAVSGDFTLSGTTLTIAAGSTTSTGTVTLTAVNNTVDAPDKTVTVSGTATGGHGVSAPASQTLTIRDDEGTPTVSLVLTPSSVAEDGGVSRVTAILSGTSSESVTVTVSATPVSPALSGDFTQSGTTLTIAAGSTTSTGTVTLTGVGNGVDAPDKTVTVSGSVTGGNGVSAPSSQTLTLRDNEGTPTVSLVLSPSSVAEDGGVSRVTATLSGTSSESVTVTVSATPVSPALSGDFTQSGTTLTIAAGSTTSTGSVTLTGVGNGVDAPDKTVTVSGSVTGGQGVSAPPDQTLTLRDNEGTPTVTLVLSPSSVAEDGGVSRVTATLSGTSSESVTVTVTATPVSPAVSGDFTQSGTTLTIAAGSTTSTGSVTVTGVGNTVDAPDKTVTVSGSVTGGQGVSAPADQTLTLRDNEGTPTVSLVLSPSSVAEDGGVSRVTATLSGTSSESVTVTVSATPVSPALSGDFTQSGTTLTIAAGSTTSTGSVTLTGVGNTVDAPDKTVTVSGSVTGGQGVSAPADQTLTLRDNEGTPTVSLVLSPSSVAEDGGVSRVTATLSGTSSESVTVTVSATPVSPALSGDFTQSGTTLTIAAGSTTSTGSVTLTGVGNTVDAPDKTVTVSGSVTGGQGVSAPADQTLTLRDNEGTPTVSLVLSPSSVAEDGGVSRVTATLSGTSSESVTVTVTATPVSPAVSGDFTQSGTTLTIAAGSTTSTGSVTVTGVGNTVDAPDKTVTVSGSVTGGQGASAPADQTLTLRDDEGTPTVSLVLSPSSVGEDGGVSRVTATLSGTSSESVTVTVTASPVSPALSGDFTQSGTTLTIAAGSTTSTGSVTVTGVGNTVDAPDKTVTVSGSVTGGNGVSAPPDQTLTLRDDEGAPTVSLVLSPSSVGENGGVSRVTAALSGTSSESVTVTVTATPVSPAVSSDFVQSGTTLTIAAGSTTSTGTVTVTAVDNTVHAADKMVTVSGSVTGGLGVSAPPTQQLTITDDDVLTVAVSAAAATVVEGASATFTVTLRGGTSAADVEVAYEAGGTATPGTDYVAPSGTVTVSAGASSAPVTIETLADAVLDPGETLAVTLSAASTSTGNLTVDKTAAETAIADEGTVSVSVAAGAAAVEGTEASFTVMLSGPVADAVALGWSTADGTATAGEDYTAVTDGTLTFRPAEGLEQTIAVTTLDDTLAEGPEMFTVTLTLTGPDLPDGVSLGTASAAATISDDEVAPTGVTLTLNPTTVSESAEPTVVEVTAALDGSARPGATVVTVSVGGGTATREDYAAVSSFDVTIAATETSGTGTFTLTPVDDTVAEGPETLEVSGTTTDGLTVTAAELTLTDNDSAATSVTLTLDPAAVLEDAGPTPVEVTAALDGSARADDTVVTVSVGGGTAAGEDYAAVSSFDVTIAATESSGTGTFTLTPVDDAVAEGSETLEVSGTTTVGLTVTPAELTITDNDTASGVTLTLNPAAVSEDAGPTPVEVTAALDGTARADDTVVTVSVRGGTADADDYADVPSFEVTIAASEASGTATFTLTPVDDAVAEGSETLEVSGTTTVSGLTVTAAELTLTDDDSASTGVTLTVEPPAVDEDAGATEIRVTATLDGGARPSPTLVTVAVAEDEGDYAVVPARFDLEIPAGDPSADGTFMLTPVDDAEDEQDQRVPVTGTTSSLPVTGTAVIIKDNDESNEPPVFEQERYAFDLPENRPGRETPVVLGQVGARDSDGDRIRYALSYGDRERFTVSRGSGTVSYIGEGEDFEAGLPPFEFQVTAKDSQYTAKAWVAVRVANLPEAPSAADDRAETPEDTPAVVDVLSNDTDPDGDRLRVASVGTPEHGTATVVGRRVRYVPDLNWHGRDRFSYTVADPGGLTSKATVTVTVTPVNDPPEAVDDEAETLEDVAAVVDVLANDSDVDGDPLRVVSVGPAAHGATAIADGGVRYASELNWYGTDRFTYTIADPEGLTSTATVTMTVLPVNDAPEAVGVIPDQSIEEGGAPVTVDVSPYFTDVDGDVLIYEAVSSDETAVTVTVAGATLTLAPVVTGTATVTVTAADVEGLTATQTFGVMVGDRLVRGVLADTLAALGRGYLSSARMTIGRLLETGGGGMTRMMVAGQQLSLDTWQQMGAGGLEQSHELLFRAATLQQRRSATDLLGTSADPRLQRPGAVGLMGGGFGEAGGGRDRLLQGTDVLLSFGGDDGPAGGGGPRWRVWGQGDLQSFRGAPAETTGYDGDLRTGYLGVDARLSERWLAGVAVAQSGGAGNWQVGSSSGRLTTDLTVVHPYLRWGGQDTGLWALAGVGRGTADNVRTLNGQRGASPLHLALGLVEGRRRVGTLAGRVEVGVRGEASWARLRTGGGDETVDDLEAGVRRVRTGVEVTLPLGAPGGVLLAPFGALSTRHDGGAGQTGVGLEVAGGVRATGGRVRIEAQGRMLALHTASDYEERGFSVTATVGGGTYEPGLSASLRPQWGAPGVGADSLWQDHVQGYAPGALRNDAGVDGRVGYGMRLRGGRLLTPFGGYGHMRGAQRVQVGANLGLLGLFSGDPSSPVQIEFLGERYGRPGGADHRISLFGIVNFGARPRRTCTAAGAPCAEAGAGAERAVPDRPRPAAAGVAPPPAAAEAPAGVSAVGARGTSVG